MSQASRKLDRHFVALSAAAVAGIGAVGLTDSAEAAVVYSGAVNTAITPDFTGVYLNLVTGQQLRTGVGATDINPWVTGGNWVLNGTAGTTVDSAIVGNPVGSTTTAAQLTAGTQIDGTNATSLAATMQMGTGTGLIYGFRFRNESTGVDNFGWIRCNLSTVASGGVLAGTLVDYAYENTGAGIAAGDTGAPVPEPTSLGLLAAGAVGLLRRRGR